MTHCFVGSLNPQWFDSLMPGRFGSNYKSVISKHMFRIKFMSISNEIILRWMWRWMFSGERHRAPLMIKSALLQVMAWCHQASDDGSTLLWDCSTIQTISNRIEMMWYKIAFHPKLNVHNMRDRNPKSMVYTDACLRRNVRLKDFCLS